MKRNRSVLLCASGLLAGVAIGVPAPATASLPSTVTHVTASAGVNTTGINGHVHVAATISGTITSATGNHPVSTGIQAFLGSSSVAFGFADGSGHFTIRGLAPSSTGYAVCASGSSASGGGSTTGYLGRCYKTAAWNGGAVPSGAVKVKLTSGQQKTGVNIALPSAAAISGKVTKSSGTGLNFVFVSAHNRTNGLNYGGITSSTGAYSIKGLTASTKGYTVCFNPSSVAQGTGYRPRCYKNVAWTGGSLPSTATKVSVSLGHTHSGISGSVPVGGAISGTITDASNGHAITNGGVNVFTSAGKSVGFASTDSHGHYTARGLAPSSSYRVCAFPASLSVTVSYKGKCWVNVAWKGGRLPSGTRAVSVTQGHTHAKINFKLTRVTVKLGSIAGTITEKASGTPLQFATVSVFRSGTFVGNASTDAAGHYKVSNLRASSGYVVCAQGQFATSSTVTTPATGWAPRCHTDVAWTGLNPPSGANKVALSAGQNKTGINTALHVGGEISGTVFVFGGSTPASFVTVKLYTASGKSITSTSSSFDGTYSFTGLSPASASATTGYTVCFDGRNAFTGTGFLPQCYNNVAWNGNG